MPDAHGSCPDYEALEAHLRDDAGDSVIATHVKGCTACQNALREISANNALLERIHRSIDRSTSWAHNASRSNVPAIPGFTIHEELHRGGQGIVYRATQHATSREVALKVLLAGAFATSGQRQRFESETVLMAGLEHPNIVTVFDSGCTPEGLNWLAMQYVDAPALNEWRAQRLADDRDPLTLTRVLQVFAAICDGVAAAHQRGVIHRDLKPANVLVDNHDQPHVMDFGLARRTTLPADSNAARMTVPGTFLGTLAYAAPEQMRSDTADVDIRADVYALGVILYELLTGRWPHDFDSDLHETLRVVAEDEPRPMYNRVDNIPWRIDRDLETIARTALAKDRTRRYESAAALRDDIRRYLEHRPIAARRDSAMYVLRKTVLRHRAVASIGLAFLLLLAAFIGATVVQNRRIAQEANKVRQINLFLEDTLSSVTPVRSEQPVTVRNFLDESVMWIDIALEDQPEVAASIHTIVGNGYRNLGEYELAEAQLVEGYSLRAEHEPANAGALAQSLNALALLRQDSGDFEAAEQLLREALELRSRAFGRKSYETSLTHASLSRLYQFMGRLDEAETHIRESHRIRMSIFGERHADIAMCLFAEAEIARRQSNEQRAIELHERALDMRRDVLHPDHPDRARSMLALGQLLMNRGERERAIELFNECLELRTRTLPAEHQLIDEARTAVRDAMSLSS